MTARQSVRRPCGGFYPSNPEKLRSMIRQMLDAARERGSAGADRLLAPHAGYDYSGARGARLPATRRRAIERR